MDQQILQNLLVEQIKDLYDAEQQLVKALPKLAEAASSPDLKEALSSHLEETKSHVSRLEQVFSLLDEIAESKRCKGMQGLIAEGDEAIKHGKQGELRDLAIIAGGQRVEHYEISAYGTAKAIATKLGLEAVVGILSQTEKEEGAADAKLTEVAEGIYEAPDDESAEEATVEEVVSTPARKSAGSARPAASTGRRTSIANRK
jgi:ferritin-like metal-binding protein YciE